MDWRPIFSVPASSFTGKVFRMRHSALRGCALPCRFRSGTSWNILRATAPPLRGEGDWRHPCFDPRNPCQFRRSSPGSGPGPFSRLSLDIARFTPDSSVGGTGVDRYRSAGLRPLRLVAQDASLSRWKQGFDSPRGRHRPGCTEHIWVWRLVGVPRLRIKSGALPPVH